MKYMIEMATLAQNRCVVDCDNQCITTLDYFLESV